MSNRFIHTGINLMQHLRKYHYTHEGKISEQFYTIQPVINDIKFFSLHPPRRKVSPKLQHDEIH